METLVRNLRAAGLTPEQIVRVIEVQQNEKLALRREQNRINKRNQRSRHQFRDDIDDTNEINQQNHDVKNTVSTELMTCPDETPLTYLSSSLSSLEVPLKEEKQVEEEIVEGRKRPLRPNRGAKIPDDWVPPDELREYAIKLGYSTPQYQSSMDGMVDWARANANRQVARKADWTATARGWLRREADRLGIKTSTAPPTNGYHPPPGAVSVLEIMRKARENAEGTQVRGNTGVGKNGTDHAAELPLSGGSLLQGKIDRPKGCSSNDRPRH